MAKTKAILSAFLIAIVIIGLTFVDLVHFGTAQSGTNVSGILSVDTIWTQANSPYILTGNVLVNSSVSLTVQPGVTVNFNGYYLRVNGTLNAQGTPNNNIVFNIPNGAGSGDGAIEFERSSQSWNYTTESGSIIKNALIASTWELYPTILIDSVSPKIDNNTIYCTNVMSNNDAINVLGTATPSISNNTIKGQITANGGTICNNTIMAATLAGIWLTGNTTAYGNTVFGCGEGILATTSYENYNSSSSILGNLVFNNTRGLELEIYSVNYARSIITQNNTVCNNTDGVMIGSDGGPVTYSILNNNIYNNMNYNFLLAGGISQDFNATYNWWGTNDSQAIGPRIWDFKYNFNLGTVNYVPFLLSINPQAPIYNFSGSVPLPTPTPTPTQSPAPTLTPTATPTPTPLPTSTPTASPTPVPTSTPTQSPAPTSTPIPTSIPTPTPTTTPILTPIPTPTPGPTLKPTLVAPTIAVSCQSSASYLNFKVEITGTLTANGTVISNAPVLLSYSVNEGISWTGLTTAGTDNSGNFAAVWFPSASGTYLLNAQWYGNSTFSDANTTINFAVLPYQEQSVFSVSSNSAISAFAFNSTSQELSFSISGPSGTTGYVDIYIPKSLISDVSNLKVYLDGNQLTYATASQGDSWLVSFAYHHSTHQVEIDLGSPQSNSFIQSQLGELVISGVALSAIIIIVIVFVIRSKKNKLKMKKESELAPRLLI
jgi:hypothetical protein